MDALAFHPYMDNSSQPADAAAPEHDDDLDQRLRQARARRSAPPSTAPRSPARRCRSCTTSSASRARPGGEGGALHGHRAGDDEAGRRGDAGALLRDSARARVLPAERAGALPLPHRGRACARPLAVRPLLRGRARPRRASRASRPRSRSCGAASLARCPGLRLPVKATGVAFPSAARRRGQGAARGAVPLRPRLRLLGPPRAAADPCDGDGCAAAAPSAARRRGRSSRARRDEAQARPLPVHAAADRRR